MDHGYVHRGDLQEPDGSKEIRTAGNKDDRMRISGKLFDAVPSAVRAGGCPWRKGCLHRAAAVARRAAATANRQSRRGDRPDGLLGFGRYGRLALSDGDARAGRLQRRADDGGRGKIADAWDPAKDEAAGDQCKSYGAPNILRVPGRLHVTWQDDQTLKMETDAGKQTRIFISATGRRKDRHRCRETP